MTSSTTPSIIAAATYAPSFTPDYKYSNPEEWCTPDDRLICFTCSHVGRISRHCCSRCPSSLLPLNTATPTCHAVIHFIPICCIPSPLLLVCPAAHHHRKTVAPFPLPAVRLLLLFRVLLGKLGNAAPGGDSVLLTRTPNPLMTVAPRNLVNAFLDGLPVKAGVDTGTDVPVHSSFR